MCRCSVSSLKLFLQYWFLCKDVNWGVPLTGQVSCFTAFLRFRGWVQALPDCSCKLRGSSCHSLDKSRLCFGLQFDPFEKSASGQDLFVCLSPQWKFLKRCKSLIFLISILLIMYTTLDSLTGYIYLLIVVIFVDYYAQNCALFFHLNHDSFCVRCLF